MTEKVTSRASLISNLIAQLAVVASLLYVGYEIRLNTRVARAQAHQDLVSLIMSIGDNVVDEIDDVAALRARADSGLDRMSASDRMRFMTFTNRYMNLYELAFDQHQDGLLGDDVWEGFRISLERQFQRRSFNEYWAADRPVFGPRFAAFADSAQARAKRE
jgi:hypothetical protein